MVYYDSDAFLTKLTALLKTAQTSQTGSVLFTYKRFTPHADESVRLLQRTSLSHQNKHSHKSKKSNNDTPSTSTQSSNSHHPAAHVSVNTEPVLLIHCKYKQSKLVTTVTDKQTKSFIKSLNAIMTVHNTLLEANEPPPPRPKRMLPTSEKKAGKRTAAAAAGSSAGSAPSTAASNKPSKKQKQSNTNKGKTAT